MTTLRRLKYDSGKLAVYDVDSAAIDDNPLTAPLSYLSRLQYHSDLEYPKVIATYTGTITLAVVTANQLLPASFTIAAHGRGAVPYVEGMVKVGGVWRGLCGSTPVDQLANPSVNATYRPGFIRWLALGADATNIYIKELTLTNQAGGFTSTQSVDYRIWLLDTLL